MSPKPVTRTTLIAGGMLLVLLLGITGFAVGRSMRTSKEQARNAGRLSMVRSYDASFRSAYTEGNRSGFARGLPEGEALGKQRGAVLGRRQGELVKARRQLRRAGRHRAGARRLAHRPRARVAPAERRAARRRKTRRPPHHAHRPKLRERAERESLRGEGREGEEGAPEPRERAGRTERLR
ncbi:MAG TPA: hypothetical protein VGO14_03555 [Solirubrobacteraceae bacterium]|jgi:hypothetical protein|nr:hypothetical protein [Solirubrobacteraceae bacterium]